MKCKGLMLFVFMILVMTAMSNTEAVGRDEIRVLSSAAVKTGPVYLSDIAVVKAEGLDKSRLEKLIVAQYESQEIISVGVFEICQALSQAQINPAALDIFGAGACQVTFEGVTTTGVGKKRQETQIAQGAGLTPVKQVHTLADELTRIVGEMASLDAGRLKVDWYCTRRGFLEQASEANRFKIVPRSTMNLGRVQFDVVDNHQADLNKVKQAAPGWQPGTVLVRGNVQYLCESVVASRPLKAGDVIAFEDVMVLPQRVTSMRNVGVDDVRLVVGQEAARSISVNTIIHPEMIRKLQIIKRKQTVRVESKVGAVQMSMRGEAMGDGGLGDVIPVRTVINKKIIHGRIIGPGLVTVSQETDDVKMNQTSDRGVFVNARKL
ncbi:MAG: flagellar basal body P-ring formation protein FlgA [Planctomycetes bacterium]|nr:flagellar basal body P-ring formation protein FlgA [Planctomycetota bacterium]